MYLRLIEILEMQMIIFYYYVKDLHEIADILGVLYQDDCKAEQLRFYPHEIPNNIDIEDIIYRIEANDPDLTEVNLNNIRNIQCNQWRRLFTALENSNTMLKTLNAANCNLKDTHAEALSTALAKNSSLQALNLDSNLFSSKSVVNILRAIASSKSIKEVRLNNQVGQLEVVS